MKFRTINDGNGKTGILMSNTNQKGEEAYIPRTINIAGTVMSNSNQTEDPYVPKSLDNVIPKKVFEPNKGTFQPPPDQSKGTRQPNGKIEEPYVPGSSLSDVFKGRR